MKNIGYVSRDQALKAMIRQLNDSHETINFYEIDHELTVIEQYNITHVVFDFDNFDSLEDTLQYQHMCELSKMRFLIIGNEISALLHNKLRNEKVIGHLLKPVSSESLYAGIKYHLLDQKAVLNENIEESHMLFGSRLYSCLLGYYFLNKAVQYCHDHHVDDSVRMAVIYDYIALNYHTTKSKVEKSIRKLIAVFEKEQHWTNSETILYFYKQLHLEHLEPHQ